MQLVPFYKINTLGNCYSFLSLAFSIKRKLTFTSSTPHIPCSVDQAVTSTTTEIYLPTLVYFFKRTNIFVPGSQWIPFDFSSWQWTEDAPHSLPRQSVSCWAEVDKPDKCEVYVRQPIASKVTSKLLPNTYGVPFVLRASLSARCQPINASLPYTRYRDAFTWRMSPVCIYRVLYRRTISIGLSVAGTFRGKRTKKAKKVWLPHT